MQVFLHRAWDDGYEDCLGDIFLEELTEDVSGGINRGIDNKFEVVAIEVECFKSRTADCEL
jgi:hypothetical protein